MLAVAMLNGMTAKTEARRIALSVSTPSLISARVADVIAGFYRSRPAGDVHRRPQAAGVTSLRTRSAPIASSRVGSRGPVSRPVSRR